MDYEIKILKVPKLPKCLLDNILAIEEELTKMYELPKGFLESTKHLTSKELNGKH